jgi:hypothetical protein
LRAGGADFGASVSDANALASESDNGGSGASSTFAGCPAGGALLLPGAAVPFPPFPPWRDVFLPCLPMGRIMALARTPLQ